MASPSTPYQRSMDKDTLVHGLHYHINETHPPLFRSRSTRCTFGDRAAFRARLARSVGRPLGERRQWSWLLLL